MVDFQQGLRHCDGDHDIYQAVLQQFVAQYRQPIRLPEDEPQHEQALLAFHTLKGLSATVGANALSEAAQQLYIGWPSLNKTEQKQQIAQLNERREQTVDAIEQYLYKLTL